MRRSVVLSAVLAGFAILAGYSGSLERSAFAQSPSVEACALLTARDASKAMGEPMHVVRDDPDYCVFYGKADRGGNIATMSLRLQTTDPSTGLTPIDQARQWYPGADEVQVGDVPGLRRIQDSVGSLRSGELHVFPAGTTWLSLSLDTYRRLGVAKVLASLAGTALQRFGQTATSSPGASPVGSPAASQPAVASACSLLTAEEVSSALGGGQLAVVADHPLDCVYSGEGAGDPNTGMVTTIAVGAPGSGSNLDAARATYPDAQDVQVAGLPALLTATETLETGWTKASIHVFPDAATWLTLEPAAPQGVDIATAVTGLAELAIPRLVASLPSSSPAASGGVSTDLAAALPADVGGSPMAIKQTGSALGGVAFPTQKQIAAAKRVQKLLKQFGRKADEMKLTFAQNESQTAAILAIQLPGADIGPFVEPLSTYLDIRPSDPQPDPATVAAKPVTAVSVSGQAGYSYPKDDVLWLVIAQGDDLTEVFQELP